MRTLEAFISGALVLIGLYLLFNSQQAAQIIRELATGSTRIITALQGRGFGA
jgi:multisubunit Na+/H+ antiporter MnhC subunit